MTYAYLLSHRYMAPEVARCEPYEESSDVYSFSLVCWEVCTLSRPLDEVSASEDLFSQKVVYGDHRPALTEIPTSSLKKLLSDGWSPIPDRRPAMWTMREVLEEEIEAMQTGYTRSSRHSTRSLYNRSMIRRRSRKKRGAPMSSRLSEARVDKSSSETKKKYHKILPNVRMLWTSRKRRGSSWKRLVNDSSHKQLREVKM